MSEHWFTFITRPLGEKVAAIAVEREDFLTFVPRCRERSVSRTGKVFGRESNMFPGYIFVRVDLGKPSCWRICRAPGIVKVMSIAGQPAVMPDAMLAELRSRTDEGDGAIDLWRPFRFHEELLVTSGHLQGKTGRYLWSAKDRIALLMQVALGSMVVELDSAAIEAAA